MKPWIQRSLIGLFGGALVLGSLGACSSYRHGWSGGNAEAFRARIVERVGNKLDLDNAQRQKLTVLADTLQAQRNAMRGGGDPRAEFRSLFSSDRFDQARAAQLVDDKTAAIRTGSPAVIAAAADFFDHLRPNQQQKVRDFMARGRRHA